MGQNAPMPRRLAPTTAFVMALALACLAPLAVHAQAPAPSAPAAATQPASGSPALAPAATLNLPPIKPAAANAADANPYGLAALWAQGDPVARGTLLILALMSLGSWYVLITKLVAQGRMATQGRVANEKFWKADTVRGGAQQLQAGSPYRYIVESALEATGKHEGLIGNVDLNTWLAQSIERAVATVHSRTQEGLAVLATVGSTAPFVGLFGTVWGIYNALVRIGASGQASIDKVAGPVGEALIMTAIGLAVAVPAVLGYNWLVRRNKVAMDTVRAFGSDLHTVLLASGTQRG